MGSYPRWERYHAPVGRSVTDFTGVRWQKGTLLFCGAKCRLMTDAVEKGFGSILVSLDVALMIAARRW